MLSRYSKVNHIKLRYLSYTILFIIAIIFTIILLDFQNDSRSSSIRTPKRLLFKFKKRKDHDPNNNKIKTEEVKSTYKKKHKKKFKWIGSSKLPIGDESHQFKTFKLDLSKIKNEQDDSSGKKIINFKYYFH